MTDARTLGGSRAPRIVEVINPLVRRLLRIGLPLGPNVMLTVTGRTTGNPHTFPIAIMPVGDRRYVQSPYGEVHWVRNLRANPDAVLTKGRRQEPVEAVETAPEDAVGILRAGVEPYLRSRIMRPLA